MISIKTIFSGLSKIMDWLWNINLVLGIGSIIFLIINLITKKLELTANYLGNFKIIIHQVGNMSSEINNTKIYLDNMIGSPALLLNSNMHQTLIFGYTLFIVTVVLIYNYQLMKLFNSLNSAIKENALFISGITEKFNTLAKVSLIVFCCGLLLSICKLWLINSITFGNITLIPIFDNGIINFAWLGIGFFIISGIFKIGFELKKEQDLTI